MAEQPINHPNLHVGNLPLAFGESDLRRYFEPYGKIEHCKIITAPDGSSRGYGFIYFSKVEEAQKAYTNLNGRMIDGRNLTINAAEHSDGPGSVEPPAHENLYIRNLPLNYSEETLREVFCQYGTIVHVKLLVDKVTNQSRGCGFVKFDNVADAEKAKSAISGATPDGASLPIEIRFADTEETKRKRQEGQQGPRVIRGGFGNRGGQFHPYQRDGANSFGFDGQVRQFPPVVQPGGSSYEPNNVYVGNLPPEYSELQLYKHFAPFGGISSVKHIADRNIAFVRYNQPEEATNAIQAMNGFNFSGSTFRVNYKFINNAHQQPGGFGAGIAAPAAAMPTMMGMPANPAGGPSPYTAGQPTGPFGVPTDPMAQPPFQQFQQQSIQYLKS